MAVVLAAGGVAGHRSALRLWGLDTRFAGLEVVLPYACRSTLAGVIVHRSRTLAAEDVAVVDAIAVTTVARTLFDVAGVLPGRALGRLVDHAIATDLVTPADLAATRERIGGRGRAGQVRLDAAIGVVPEAAESGPEAALGRALATIRGFRPVAQHELVLSDVRYRLDLAYPAHRLAVEYDGFAAHSGHRAFEQDRTRQNDLVRAGWTVLRFTARDLRERLHQVVAEVEAMLNTLPTHPPPNGL